MALLIYGAMHFYALGKVWMAFPHSSGLGLSLAFWGIVMALSPLILWQMTRQNWHGASRRYCLGDLSLDGIPVPVLWHRPDIRLRPCTGDTPGIQVVSE